MPTDSIERLDYNLEIIAWAEGLGISTNIAALLIFAFIFVLAYNWGGKGGAKGK